MGDFGSKLALNHPHLIEQEEQKWWWTDW